MRCECGCGFEGEDDVTQFCIEEAVMIALDISQSAAVEEHQLANAEPEPEIKPGQITDPKMIAAMAEAKRIHREMTGREAL